MTGETAEPSTAASVAHNFKRAWSVAVDLIAGGSSLRSLVAIYAKVPPNAEAAKNIEDSDGRPQYFTHNSSSRRRGHQSGSLWSSSLQVTIKTNLFAELKHQAPNYISNSSDRELPRDMFRFKTVWNHLG